ncbi:MAG: quinolinate synthase NadA [Bacteroidales bacterium]|jgi:quinolinate synthase|nr:quinolinate synthase NadA [Bacteroidales bacterium]
MIQSEIQKLKQQKNAVILAHYYQTPDIQDIADYIGDSLELAQKAKETTADIIVFAGVHFMAETAKILNSGKKVLIPDMEAGCSLSDSCNADELAKAKAAQPNRKIIAYANCSAAVKELVDITCTSGNAVRIVNSFPAEEKLLFVPDKNLGGYINRITGRNMDLWDGSCAVHDMLNAENVLRLKQQHPEAAVIAHPECNPAVLALAEFIGSTSAMLRYIQTDNKQNYIVATETGIVHQMKKAAPYKTFYIVSTDETCACNDCPYMKKNTLEKILKCLHDEAPEITLTSAIIQNARKPIEAMLAIAPPVIK